MAEMPVVDLQKCNGCGLCVDVCLCGAIVLAGDKVTVVETEDCHWCTLCEAVCPVGAIACAFEIVIEGSLKANS